MPDPFIVGETRETYVVLGRENCPFCDKAKELLKEKGLSYVYYDVRKVPFLRTLCLLSGFTTVPRVFNPLGDHVGGYDDLKELLG